MESVSAVSQILSLAILFVLQFFIGSHETVHFFNKYVNSLNEVLFVWVLGLLKMRKLEAMERKNDN